MEGKIKIEVTSDDSSEESEEETEDEVQRQNKEVQNRLNHKRKANENSESHRSEGEEEEEEDESDSQEEEEEEEEAERSSEENEKDEVNSDDDDESSDESDDEEGIRGKKSGKQVNQVNASNVELKKRSKKIHKDSDCENSIYRYATPPVSNHLSFRGVPFVYNPSEKLSEKLSFPTPSSSSSVKYLRLSMDADVEGISPKSVVERLLHSFVAQQKNQKKNEKTVDVLNIEGEDYSVEFAKPRGDEIFIGATTKDIEYVGDRLIGTVYIHKGDENDAQSSRIDGEEDEKKKLRKGDFAEMERSLWQEEQSFVSWHKKILP